MEQNKQNENENKNEQNEDLVKETILTFRMEQSRIAKVMILRTLFDPDVPPTTNLYKTIQQILDLHGEKVILHPSDGRRVLHALKFFVQDVNIDELNTLVASKNIRLRQHLRSRL